ncbi:hypothetical protein ABH940_006087 [Streptacidiphilus sp. BW17]|uniref:hypothetical protein n=1 Tax=Streptacidiphilus sp. BW17 TaxID=3156274 RepID=UPI003517C11D
MVIPLPAEEDPPGSFADLPLTQSAVWPELWQDLPALVFPARPGHPTETGWLPADAADFVDDAVRWRATLDDGCLRVTRPDGLQWYHGLLHSTRAWRRVARARGRLLLVTGPFTHPVEFPSAALCGHLLVAVADLELSGLV